LRGESSALPGGRAAPQPGRPRHGLLVAPSPIRLDAAAGGAGGSWSVLLEGLAKLVQEIHPWIELRVVEGGGVMNHADVGTGRVPVAILNPPMTAAALAGRSPFEQALPDLSRGNREPHRESPAVHGEPRGADPGAARLAGAALSPPRARGSRGHSGPARVRAGPRSDRAHRHRARELGRSPRARGQLPPA